MNNKSRISILGCGWLGFPLARQLAKDGYIVKGSTTSHNKLLELAAHNIDPFSVQLSPHLITTTAEKFFQSDILIIAIPPKKDPDNYLLQIEELIKIIANSPIKQVFFISSTSVYGNNNREVDEGSSPVPDTPSGKAIYLAENLLPDNRSFQTTIIRFGGLIGPGRNPAKFLSGKTSVPNGQAPVNLIQLEDCIGIINSILANNIFGKIFNACSPDHPSRKDFYTLASKITAIPEPLFIDELTQWKIIKSINVPRLLNYDYKIKNWTDWLRSGYAEL